jgi:metal-responsive CopG/Arc/MetJ family transcriptional regulator
MSTVNLDEETERHLSEILTHEEKADRSELIKRLIRERWLSLQSQKTIVERRGGHPQHLLEDAPEDLSERSKRKQVIAELMSKKQQ